MSYILNSTSGSIRFPVYGKLGITHSPQMNDTSFLLCLYCSASNYSHFYSISSDQSGVLSTGCCYGQSFQRFLNRKVNYNFQSFHIMYPREILDSNGNWPKHNSTKRFTLCTKEILLYCYLGLQGKRELGIRIKTVASSHKLLWSSSPVPGHLHFFKLQIKLDCLCNLKTNQNSLFPNQREKNHTHLEGSWPQPLLGDKGTSIGVIHSISFKSFKTSTTEQTSKAQNGGILIQPHTVEPYCNWNEL